MLLKLEMGNKMYCIKCGAQVDGFYCPECGEPVSPNSDTIISDSIESDLIETSQEDHSNYSTEKGTPKTDRMMKTILWLIFFFPVGLIIMWYKKEFTKSVRIAITIFFAIVFIYLL